MEMNEKTPEIISV